MTTKIQPHTKLTADESAAFLTEHLLSHAPFLFLRYGDGALECINGIGRGTCDGEQYTPTLGADLLLAWHAALSGKSPVYVGDWLSASFDPQTEHTAYADLYAALIGEHKPTFLHFESLLLMRESCQIADFYRAVRADPRRKLLMAPECMKEGARMLGAEHLIVPMGGLHRHVETLDRKLRQADFDILLWGAGMAASIPVVQAWERNPERTYINIGSALDPLFRGKTRKTQLTQAQARRLLRDLL